MEENIAGEQEVKRELTAREIVSVVIRLAAVLVFVGLVWEFLGLVAGLMVMTQELNGLPRFLGAIFIAATVLATLVVAGWLWLFPESISDRIVPKEYDGYIRLDLSLREIEAIAFSLLGVFLLSQAIPRLAQIVTNLWSQIQINSVTGLNLTPDVSDTYSPLLVAAIVQIVIAVILFRWSRRIVKQLYYSDSAEHESSETVS